MRVKDFEEMNMHLQTKTAADFVPPRPSVLDL
jgi:hypothetical protein